MPRETVFLLLVKREGRPGGHGLPGLPEWLHLTNGPSPYLFGKPIGVFSTEKKAEEWAKSHVTTRFLEIWIEEVPVDPT